MFSLPHFIGGFIGGFVVVTAGWYLMLFCIKIFNPPKRILTCLAPAREFCFEPSANDVEPKTLPDHLSMLFRGVHKSTGEVHWQFYDLPKTRYHARPYGTQLFALSLLRKDRPDCDWSFIAVEE